jgi:hypothetical protein
MLANWIHIVIVHFAVIGTPWLLYRAVKQRNDTMDNESWKLNYSVLILFGITAGIAYFTGPEAADYLKGFLEGYNQNLVENHALWGRVAFVIQVIAAFLGIMGWASILQEEKPDKRIAWLIIALLAVNILVMLYTAHLGGEIRRPDLIF